MTRRRRDDLSKYNAPKIDKTKVCTKSTERCAKTTDPSTGCLYVPPCCRQHIRDLFNTVIDAFEEFDIYYWLDYGTLLGATRNGNFIPHDDDADFSTLVTEENIIREALEKYARDRDYILRNAFAGDGLQLYLSETNKLHVDIFFWIEDGVVMRRNSYVKGTDDNKGKDFPKEWLEPRSDLLLDGRSCKAPKYPEQMCEWRYGESWRTPMRIFQFNNTPNKYRDKKW